MSDIHNILRIDASARKDGSITRDMADETLNHFAALGPIRVETRNVGEGLPFVDQDWVGANFTPIDARTNAQIAKLALSDKLIAELASADTLVLATPIYNFGIPASLKAWIDLIARAGVTFKYTESGPQGLLTGKKAVVLMASGGTPLGSSYDYASPYLRHVLGFMGITDIEFIAQDVTKKDAAEKRADVSKQIKAL